MSLHGICGWSSHGSARLLTMATHGACECHPMPHPAVKAEASVNMVADNEYIASTTGLCTSSFSVLCLLARVVFCCWTWRFPNTSPDKTLPPEHCQPVLCYCVLLLPPRPAHDSFLNTATARLSVSYHILTTFP